MRLLYNFYELITRTGTECRAGGVMGVSLSTNVVFVRLFTMC